MKSKWTNKCSRTHRPNVLRQPE